MQDAPHIPAPEQMAAHVEALVEAEMRQFLPDTATRAATLADFSRMRVRRPRPITVNFSGGITQTCWSVTRSNGAYSVLYLPTAGYFSLCVDSDFGPLDIGVHGPAIAVFSAV
ncbi:hypothetical protein [Thalassococcus lentus]|uniref:Uncharacterized protein n=1 Tax=Thalassococcus lentus TaxID=1210524 RepID=A0ABT4XVE7_9RHOB|nr:hypothetical protein [Thalassococcus lentus]MDA7425825.1 hypothetical protein [Thalassococcus lentus]